MQGARTVPIQLDCTKGEVAIGLDGDPSTPTRGGSQPVSALGLESAIYLIASVLSFHQHAQKSKKSQNWQDLW
jgi:hypothetical protein